MTRTSLGFEAMYSFTHLKFVYDPNPSIRGVGAPMDGLSALPWTARWCQGTLPCPESVGKRGRPPLGRVERLAMDGPPVSRYFTLPQSVDKRCRRSHGRVERLAMDGPLVSRYLTLPLRRWACSGRQCILSREFVDERDHSYQI